MDKNSIGFEGASSALTGDKLLRAPKSGHRFRLRLGGRWEGKVKVRKEAPSTTLS